MTNQKAMAIGNDKETQIFCFFSYSDFCYTDYMMYLGGV